ncbi:MAG: hypothetical protein U0002_02160 [Thermoanaerobaculia bacterium]
MSEPQVPPTPPPGYSSAPPPPPSSGGSDNRNLMIVLSYLGILALIPLLTEKNDQEVQWHAKHGLVLTVAWFILCVVLGMLGVVLSAAAGPAGCLVGLMWPLMVLGILGVTIACIMKGINGQRFLIPGLSDFANKF